MQQAGKHISLKHYFIKGYYLIVEKLLALLHSLQA